MVISFTPRLYLLVLVVLLSFQPRLVGQATGAQSSVSETVRATDAIKRREFIYLHVDRTLYEPGDRIDFRAYLTDGFKNLAGPLSDVVSIDLIGPNGAKIQTINLGPDGDGNLSTIDWDPDNRRPVHLGNFHLPRDGVGGRYTLRAYTNWLGNFGDLHHFTRYVYVQNTTRPNMLIDLEPARESFGPGDTLTYNATLRDRFGEPIVGSVLQADIRMDGSLLKRVMPITGAEGKVSVVWPLPAALATTDVLLSVTASTTTATETVLRRVSISLDTFHLSFYPEGGYRAVNADQVIAFHAESLDGKATDFSGQIFADGKPVMEVSSTHNGYGQFELPAYPAGTELVLRTTRPVRNTFRLPDADANAVAAHFAVEKGKGVLTTPANSVIRSLRIVTPEKSYYRDELVDGRSEVDLSGYPGGIYKIIAFDGDGLARWERVFYLAPITKAKIDLLQAPQIGGPDSLLLALQDSLGQKVQGAFSVAIVDDALYTRQNDKQANIQSQLLLNAELRGNIFEPNDFFDPMQPGAHAALESVVLCHGWRGLEWRLDREVYEPFKTGFVGYYQKTRSGISRRLAKPFTVGRNTFLPDTNKVYTVPLLNFADFAFTLLGEIPAYYGYRAPSGLQILPGALIYAPGQSSEEERKAQGIRRAQWKRINITEAETDSEMGINIRGSRGNTTDYYVDGVRVRGLSSIPDSQLEEVVVTGYGSSLKGKVSGAVVTHYSDSGLPGQYYSLRKRISAPAKPYFQLINIPTRMPVLFRTYSYPNHIDRYPPKGIVPNKLAWQGSVTFEKNGTVIIPTDVPDATATYRIVLEGIADDGSPIHAEKTFHTAAALEIVSKLPTRAVVGDTLLFTAAIRNNRDTTIEVVHRLVLPPGLTALSPPAGQLTLAPLQELQISRLVVAKEASSNSRLKWMVGGTYAKNSPSSQSKITVLPKLFTHEIVGLGQGKQEQVASFTTPGRIGGLTTKVEIFSGPGPELNAQLAAMLSTPNGCLEQTVSAAFPNIYITRLLAKDPAFTNSPEVRKALARNEEAIKKLNKFVGPNGGFALYPGSKERPDLTAYAVEFLREADREPRNTVDKAMLKNAEDYLSDTLHRGGFSAHPNQVFQLMAIRESTPEIDRLIAQHTDHIKAHPEEVFHAILLAHLYLRRGEKQMARSLVQWEEVEAVLGVERDRPFSSLSLSHSYGIYRSMELLGWYITALEELTPNSVEAQTAMGILQEYVGKKRYLSGQLRLRYLQSLLAMETHRKGLSAGTVEVRVNGKSFANQRFQPGEITIFDLDLRDSLLVDSTKITVRYAKAAAYPTFRFRAAWQRALPEPVADPPLTLSVGLPEYVTLEEPVRMSVSVENVSGKYQYAPMVQVGLPGNAQLLAKDLDRLMDLGEIDFYEFDGAYLNLYFTELEAGERIDLQLDLTAESEGRYSSPTSVAYPYYTPDQRHYVAGSSLSILRP